MRKNEDEWVLTVKDARYQIVFDDLKLVQVTPLNDGKQDGNKGKEDVDNHLEKIISFAIEKNDFQFLVLELADYHQTF